MIRTLTRGATFQALVLLAAVTHAGAQTGTVRVELQPGEPIRRGIGTDEVHRLELRLEPGQFASVSVVEEGIDVSVKVTGPGGRLIGWYDGGKDEEGHDPLSAVTLFAHESGSHWLDIHPMGREPGADGRYTARFERLEPAAETPAGRAAQWLSPWDRQGEPGVAVGVARAGATLFAGGYGEADVEHGAPITPRTVFHVASVSKQVVAFAVQLLVERGELSLEDDIRTHLPWVPDFGTPIRVRHLLHHTHGLPGQLPRLKLSGWDGHDVHRQRHVLDLVRSGDALYFEPGAEYMYTNTGYELLVEVVEAVTGQAMRAWASANLFDPLGMTRTFFHDDLHEVIPDAAEPYFVDAERGVVKEPERVNVLLGGLGLHTTVEDLLKWASNLNSGALGGPAVRDRMREPGTLNDGTVLSYSSGLETMELNGHRVFYHGGDFMAFEAIVAVYPDDGLSVVVLSNRGEFDRSPLAFRLGELFLADTVAGNLPYAEMERYSGPPGVGDPAAGEPFPERLDDRTGRYAFPGAELDVFRAGDRLWTQEVGANYVTALRLSGDTAAMVLPRQEPRLVFERDSSGAVVGLRELTDGDTGNRAARVRPHVVTPAALRRYEGSYRSDALESTWTFVVRDGRLVATHRRMEDIGLDAVSRDRFLGRPWFFREVDFVRDPGGAVVAVEISSERVRKERFERLPGK